MNRPIDFLDLKTPDHSVVLQEFLQKSLSKINEAPHKIHPDHWVIYCNDRKVQDWKKRIRPRSKLVCVAIKEHSQSIAIAFENKEIVVVDKPPGLPTQKTLRSFEDNLYDQVRRYFILQKNFPLGLPYVGLHHRLDRGTSGLVLMTKQRQVNKEVSDLFKMRKIKKTYWAYTEWGDGELPMSWEQKDKIQRGSAKKKKFFFEVGEKGDEAITLFKVLEKHPDSHYKVVCHPKTGRTHQLRVQLSHKGYPILGDSVYGNKKTASRLMLHAHQLEFSLKDTIIKVQSQQEIDI